MWDTDLGNYQCDSCNMEAENISETINNKIIILLDEAEYDNYKFQSTKHLPVPWQCDAFFRQILS